MATPLHEKSTLDEIRTRFDADVERFSNLETGQAATIDAPLAMDLITQAAIAATPTIRRVLDIGCGAANNTIKLRQEYGRDFDCDICDLSLPMLERAEERIEAENSGSITVYQGDFRDIAFPTHSFDVVIAAAVLHHLRDDADWEAAFEMIFHLLRPGGSFWITDLVAHESDNVHSLMWRRYGDYLNGLGGAEYAEKVFAYIDREDSPRSVTYQIELMHRVGFRPVDILHKNSCFAAFGGIKPIIGR
ncbi:class I SAM-dependent methyltransferase [Cerasicoccus frondis]|uniref:class I SAM-dependent methyltransferase n=1 Tax=Cerasicoccus frondis TaxID=490090 RepID=UPI0028527C7D|nr:class I SAM-dependent methyltransferase [Cerasicoccus frondis]